MRVALLSLAGLVAFASASEVTPVEKVIQLLNDLKDQTESEGAEEKKVYENFACFCKDKTKKKADEILASQTLIDDESARKEEQEGIRDARFATMAELNTEIDTLSAEMKAAEEAFLAEKAKREAVIADLRKANAGLDGAIKAMGDSKPSALITMSAVVKKNLLIAEALGMTASQPKLTSLLQADGDRYEFHGGAIMDTLNELLDEFKERLSDEEHELAKVKKAHEALMKAKSDRVAAASDALEQATTEKDDAVKQVGEASKALAEESVTLADAQTYLKTMTETCELKAREWDQRSGTRAGELAALTKALEIMEGTVSEKDAAANKRAFLNQSGMVLKRPVSSASFEDDSMSFVQVRSMQRVASLVRSTNSGKRERVIAGLQSFSKKSKDAALFHFANRLKEGPFDKVKKLIAQLIERLLEESANEASHKGWCDSELAKARKARGYAHEKSEKLNAELEANEATRDKNQADVERLTDELAELNENLEEANTIRADEKATNLQTIKDGSEGSKAVKQALKILKDFYKGEHGVGGANTASVSFIQDPRHDMPEVHSGPYQGNQGQSDGILGMLQVIATDFDRTVSDTKTAEKEAHRAHVKFSRESKVSIMSAETEKKNKENVVIKMKNAITQGMDDLKSEVELMDTAVKAIEELKPACIDTGMSYEERKQKREEEIDALKTALCQLDPDGVEADC